MTTKQRQKIFELLGQGKTQQEIADAVGISRSTIHRLLKKLDEDSEDEPTGRLDDFEEETDEETEESAPLPGDEDLPPDDESDEDEGGEKSAPAAAASAPVREVPAKAEPVRDPDQPTLEAIGLLGEINRDFLKMSMREFDKAVRTFYDATEQLKTYDSSGLRAAVAEVNAIVEPIHSAVEESKKNLPLRTAVFVIVFGLTFAGGYLLGIFGMTEVVRYIFGGFLFTEAALLVCTFIISRYRHLDMLAWISAASVLIPPAFFTGFSFGEMTWGVFADWLKVLILFPVGGLAALPLAIARRNK